MGKGKKEVKQVIDTDNMLFVNMNEFVQEPTIIVDKNNPIVIYGEDNKLGYNLINYWRSVGLHRSIIKKKKSMFLGNGVDINNNDKNSVNSKATLEFLKNINPVGDINDLMDKYALDIFLNGGVYLMVTWKGNMINSITHMPFEQMRPGKKDTNGNVLTYYHNTSYQSSEKWSRWTNSSQAYINEYPAFNTKFARNKPQIYFIKQYEPGDGNYIPLPDYIGAYKDLDTAKSISDFANANVHNNISPGIIIKFTGPPPSKERKAGIVAQIKEKYSNTGNSGRGMIVFLNEKEELVFEQAEENTNANLYKELTEQTQENILVSHGITRSVSGLKTTGSLGSQNEIIQGMETLRTTYIKPLQEFYIGKFNVLLDINGMEHIKLISPAPNLSQYTIPELSLVLTRDELREYLGYGPLDNEEDNEEIKKDTDE